MNLNNSAVLTLLLASASSVLAQFSTDADYLCTVHEAYGISNEGKLEPKSTTHEFLISQKFSVERATGVMAGDVKHSPFSDVSVLDLGTNEQSFKVVGVSMSHNTYLAYLEVREFVDSSSKPFLFRDRLWI